MGRYKRWHMIAAVPGLCHHTPYQIASMATVCVGLMAHVATAKVLQHRRGWRQPSIFAQPPSRLSDLLFSLAFMQARFLVCRVALHHLLALVEKPAERTPSPTLIPPLFTSLCPSLFPDTHCLQYLGVSASAWWWWWWWWWWWCVVACACTCACTCACVVSCRGCRGVQGSVCRIALTPRCVCVCVRARACTVPMLDSGLQPCSRARRS